MAYFANSSEGNVFDEQCSKCRYGEKACAIYAVQSLFNYDACNNKVARSILDLLVDNSGACSMWKEFRQDFEIDPNQLDLFP
jgi:hypothetical protein